MSRIEHKVDEDWIDYRHPRVYQRHEFDDGSFRWTAGLSYKPLAVLTALLAELPQPFMLLYVLHTSRGEAVTGRYQSDVMSSEDVLAFLQRFGDFLVKDARHDFWIYSPEAKVTLVWDRHDLLYIYGAESSLLAALEHFGYREGDLETPGPHAHHYREEFDTAAAQLHTALNWTYSPLQPGDEQ